MTRPLTRLAQAMLAQATLSPGEEGKIEVFANFR
jgi:hypothetical protein